MALPAGITPKTVTLGIGSFFDGTLVDGTVTITAPVNVVHTPTGCPLFSSALSKKFTDGSVTFDLCPTDDPGLNRVDWTYKLSVKVTGALVQPDPIYFTLPVAGPDTVDLDSLVSVPSSAGTPVSVSVLTAADLDSTMADEVTAGGSATAAAIAADPQLRAALVPKWAANTAYASGDYVLNPSGQIVKSNSAFTSGSTYTAGNWTVVSGGGSSLPTQTGNGGKYLTTDGTAASWAAAAQIQIESGGAYTAQEGRIFSGPDDPTLLPDYAAEPGDLWLPTNVQRGQGQKFTSGSWYTKDAPVTTGFNSYFDRILFMRWYLEVPLTIDQLGIIVNTGVASSTCDLAVYSDTGSIYPGTRLGYLTGLDCSTSGDKTAPLVGGGTVTIGPGHVFLAAVMHTAAATLRSVAVRDPLMPMPTPGAANNAGYIQATIPGAPPATAPVGMGGNNNVPLVFVRAA